MGASAVIRYLVDTNTVIHWINHSQAALVRRMVAQHRFIGLSSIVAHEMFFGAFNGTRPQATLEAIAAIRFPRLDFDDVDARVAGEVRAVLKRIGAPIGPYDILLAGQALARDLTLVTNNTREFQRVDGLRVEDWTTA